MPLFEYICPECGMQEELLVRGSDEPACPKCGSDELVKLTSTFATLPSTSSAPACPSGGSCSQSGGGCPYGQG